MSKRDAPAAHRNREPLLEVLRPRLSAGARVLEIASGTGQHAAWFAEALDLDWQPSEADPSLLASIEAWAHGSRRPPRPPIVLDAESDAWPVDRFDAMFSANLIHISPWQVTLGLLAGAARHLEPAGSLFLYGPFLIADEPVAESNSRFDASLRERDPRWGIRDLDAVVAAGDAVGLEFVERIAMPANNQTVHLAPRA